MLFRFLIYGLLGWGAEILWTGLPKKRPIDWGLHGHTQWWTFPIYGSAVFLFEPLHNLLRPRPWWVRGIVYSITAIGIESMAGIFIKRLTGKIPWDYTGKTAFQIEGVTRVDYVPLWFIFGLFLEPVHDYLVRTTPALRAALMLRERD